MTTFERVTRTLDRATDTFTVTESSITGLASQVTGEPDRYRDLGLVESEAPTLLFVPETYGDKVEPGDTVTWPPVGGDVYTVASVWHFAPDGVVIESRMVVRK